MTNYCSSYKIKGCPASHYLSCPAYLNGKNCWEVSKKPCCPSVSLAKCSSCGVFAKGRDAMKGELL